MDLLLIIGVIAVSALFVWSLMGPAVSCGLAASREAEARQERNMEMACRQLEEANAAYEVNIRNGRRPA